MAYQIECVVQEVGLAVNGCVSALKIKGTEGYLLKQGGEEYNVFCPISGDEKIESGEQTVLLNAKDVLNFKTAICYGIAQMLIQAKTSNTKVRLKFDEKDDSKIVCEKLNLSLTSIVLI
ncbi:MAG: hypothetical protein MJZ26_10510 [Fibrobacter sp.]|nr:hypothetical protein [Fibrobacter sp.]